MTVTAKKNHSQVFKKEPISPFLKSRIENFKRQLDLDKIDLDLAAARARELQSQI